MRASRRFLGWSIAALLAAAALGATDIAPATAASQSAPAPFGPNDVLRVGDQRGAVRALLQAAGELDHVPYHLEWALFPVGAPLVAAMSDGAIDFGYVGDATTTFGLAANARITTINVWKMEGSSNALLVPQGTSYKTIADLRGKRIGLVRGSPGHLLVVAALKQAGLPLNTVQLVYLNAADSRIALLRGSIDAWAIWDPYAATAELYDHMRPLLTSENIIKEVECGIAGEQAIATKRAMLLDFIARVRRAYRWRDTHLEEHAAVFSRETGMPLDVARLTDARLHAVVLPEVTDEALQIHQHVADLYAEAGIIPKAIDIARAYDRSFVLPPEPPSR